jgi:hypothetical protein
VNGRKLSYNTSKLSGKSFKAKLQRSAQELNDFYRQADQVQTTNFAGAIEKEERPSLDSTNSKDNGDEDKTSNLVEVM